jgi:hypothetical protein
MAWETFETRATAADQVRNLVGNIRTVHFIATQLRDARALYLAGTNPAFNAVFDQLVSTAQDRTELSAMIAALTALVITDWEANHPAVLG